MSTLCVPLFSLLLIFLRTDLRVHICNRQQQSRAGVEDIQGPVLRTSPVRTFSVVYAQLLHAKGERIRLLEKRKE